MVKERSELSPLQSVFFFFFFLRRRTCFLCHFFCKKHNPLRTSVVYSTC